MLHISLLLMKSLNKTETPIFYLQCVLCFQRQPFRFLLNKNGMANIVDPDETALYDIYRYRFTDIYFGLPG